MKRIGCAFSILLLTFLLNGCSDSKDQPEVLSGAADEAKVTAASDSTTSKSYSKQATYTSYGVRNGGRKAWRIPRKGPSFGKNIKVVFSDGHTVYVKDTSHNYREGDGFVFKPGLGPNGHGSSNTGTAHGGVYLHAPYGNRSNKVTFHFN